jgi:hypothetical protein
MGLRKSTRNLNQDSQCRGGVSNWAPPGLPPVNFLDDDLLMDLELRNLSREPNVRNWHSISNKTCCLWYRCDMTKPRVYWIPRPVYLLTGQARHCSLAQQGRASSESDKDAWKERGSNSKVSTDAGKDDFVVVGGLHSRFIADRTPWGLLEAAQNCQQAKLAYVIAQSVLHRMCKTSDCRGYRSA